MLFLSAALSRKQWLRAVVAVGCPPLSATAGVRDAVALCQIAAVSSAARWE